MIEEDAVDRRTRFGTIAVVALIHVVAILGLIRAFAPNLVSQVTETVLSTFTVTVATKPSDPDPPAQEPDKSGEAAEIGKKAVPKAERALKPKIAIARQNAPLVASTGTANAAGAANSGAGTGAGGQGSSTGSGNGGNGQGGGAASKPVKIAGDINSTRDYPADSRDARLGHEVIVYMTVGTDGRARGCRVQKASPDARADTITCALAEQRFRFKPATNAAGDPVEATYGWRQRWFLPGT